MNRTFAPVVAASAQKAATIRHGRSVAAPTHPLEQAADRAVTRALPEYGAHDMAESMPSSATDSTTSAPRIVERELLRPGQPLAVPIRSYFEPRFGCDFSEVRIHDDDLAHRSARMIGAQAYNAGQHIVFGRGRWQPDTPRGRSLLAHELAHAVQHAPDHGDAASRVWRKLDITAFDAGSFTDVQLLAYLQKLRDTNKIEDNSDSDDKARGVVRNWLAGGDDFALDPDLKVLLIKEMQSGFTGDDDERAILNLLENSARGDVETIFDPGKIDPDDLDSDFHGDEEDALQSFYDRLFVGGRKAAMKGGAAFTAEGGATLAAPYSHAALRIMIDEQMGHIDRIVRDRVPDDRGWMSEKLARAFAPVLEAQLRALPADQRDAAAQDLAGDRVQKDSQAKLIDGQMAKAATPLQSQLLGRKQISLRAEVLLLDMAMQVAFRDIAMAAPTVPADFQKLTTPLDAATKKSAKEAITPMTSDEVVAEASGAVAPPAPAFKPELPDKTKYVDKLKARIPLLIDESHASAKTRTKKEHDDPKLTRSMDAMQAIANQAKDEVDLVFGALYEKKKFSAFQGDKRSKSGVLLKKGNLRDVWQVEEDRRKADPSYKKRSAKFWLFYLIQNDDGIDQINLAHDASPSFGKESRALNDEAKLIRKAGDPFVSSEQTRLFEIGRAWDAFAQGKDVLIQLFKNPDATEDRRFLWDMYFTLMHEYLHKLAHRDYDKYAEKLGGEDSTEGNTLIEGVDSLLTEIAWSNAVSHASLPTVRTVVEPDAMKAKLPFDPDLLPTMPHRRYDTYEQATRLVSAVGIRNLYAAYFQGKVTLIGGP